VIPAVVSRHCKKNRNDEHRNGELCSFHCGIFTMLADVRW
jgi:hypothetical protein